MVPKDSSQAPIVSVQGNEIVFSNLSNPRTVHEFIGAVTSRPPSIAHQWILNFKQVEGAFPNVCVPLAGMIESLSARGAAFEFYYQNEYLRSTGLQRPMRVSENRDAARKSGLDRIWRFESPDDIYLLISSFVDELSQVIVCEKGVLEGFEWSINEVMDNVLQHSGKDFGYVMGQIHRTSKHFAFCVYDSGQGIFSSLQHSDHRPKNPVHAIQLAVTEGITRDKRIGQGNGLWGLHQIVSENVGKLSITSESACYSLTNNQFSLFEQLPQLPIDPGCVVDFQMDYAREISISKALGGYEPVNLKLESLENEAGQIQIVLKDRESGVGTRRSGERLRNELINIHRQTGQAIILDFSGLNIVSSSFADELVGKLVTEFGFFGFNNIFKLKGMGPSVQSIVQRSVAQRMMESFNGKG
jgi:hypothetical protein